MAFQSHPQDQPPREGGVVDPTEAQLDGATADGAPGPEDVGDGDGDFSITEIEAELAAERAIHDLADDERATEQEEQHPPRVQVDPRHGDERQERWPAPSAIDQVTPQEPEDQRREQQINDLHPDPEHGSSQQQSDREPDDAPEPAGLAVAHADR